MDDYEKYQQECEKIRKANNLLLKEFEVWLKSASLSKKTVDNHTSNMNFYLNDFLLYDEVIEAKEGSGSVGMFLGYWFIRKAMWASPSSIKGFAVSLKKFYAFMQEKGLIEKEDLTELKQTIKEEMPEWLATLERYDDPSIEDVW